MRIIICDDNEKECDEIKNIVQKHVEKYEDISFAIKKFTNPMDVLDYMGKNGVPDIALLDICMPGISGTQIAKELAGSDENSTDVIFLTSSRDYAVEAFSLHVEDYILKPYTKEKLEGALDRAIEKRRRRIFIPVQCGNKIHRIEINRVMYAEASRHNVEIHIRSGEVLKTRITLTELKRQFHEMHGFAVVGASYIVNLRCVQSVFPELLKMENGDIIPVPRRLRSEIKKQYFEFYAQEACGR